MLGFAGLSVRHLFTSATLERICEPQSLTNEEQAVFEYNQVMNTVMASIYGLAANFIYRIQNKTENGRALDICCGPGHFTKVLADNLGYMEVIGADLSPNMLEQARQHQRENLNFVKGDARALDQFPSGQFDLISFMNGAHHMESIGDVQDVLTEAERLVSIDGVIFVMDPVRQNSKAITDAYTELGGRDYKEKGLYRFFEDFENSMFASWRPEELLKAIPENTSRRWVLLVPHLFAPYQILIGLPKDREKVFLRKSLDRKVLDSIVPQSARLEERLLNQSFLLPKRYVVPAISKSE